MAQGQRVGYIRVSTVEQNTARQLDSVQLDKVFEEKCSGKDLRRPQLQACLEYLREGDRLIVHEMSRLARNLMDLRNLVDALVSRSVEVEFVHERIVFTAGASPMEKLLLSMMGAFSEFEREIIKERQREGIAVARSRGVYSKPRAKKLNGEQLQSIREAISRGESQRQLAKQYGVSRQTLWNHLRNTTTH